MAISFNLNLNFQITWNVCQKIECVTVVIIKVIRNNFLNVKILILNDIYISKKDYLHTKKKYDPLKFYSTKVELNILF